MAVTARVLFAVFVLFYAFEYYDSKSNVSNRNDNKEKFLMNGCSIGKKVLYGKAWRNFKSSKSSRKRIRQKRAYSVGLECMDPYFSLLLCGDVELNPGPTNSSKSTKYVARDETPDFSDILLRLEKKIDDGQESIIENQNQMLLRLSGIEKEIEYFKVEIDEIKTKQLALEERVKSMSENIAINYDHGRDLQFLMDRHEQYSRKNSVRIRGVTEQNEEDIEMVTIETLKKELGVCIEKPEIDIVHRVGRRQDNKPRSILVKFLSHKTKEKVMRAKKNAKNVKVSEDLAPGIKRIFDEVSSNRRFLNIDSVWTIDGRIKLRYVNNPNTFEIRSYADYHSVVNLKQ